MKQPGKQGGVIVWLLAVGLALLLLPQKVSAQTPCGETVTVIYGDTLSAIARRCNTNVNAILRLNPNITNPDLIFGGTVLRMPPPSEPYTGGPIYTVQPGDWLSRIAPRLNTTVQAILAINPQITNPDLIFPGQQIRVPGLQEIPITILPTSGPPGTEVQVRATGLPANAAVTVGVGQRASEIASSQQAQANAQGLLEMRVVIATGARAGEEWVVVVSANNSPERGISNVFQVTGADGQLSRVNLYLVALNDNGQAGPQIGCNDSVVPVAVDTTPTTTTPLRAALERLLSLHDEFYGQSGLYNALYRSSLAVQEATIANGQATIRLTGTLALGGVCDNPRVEAQLRQIALQFSTVQQVVITINDRPLSELLSGR